MSDDKAKNYKTGSAQKAAKQIKEVKDQKQSQLDRIMKDMQSSTTMGGK